MGERFGLPNKDLEKEKQIKRAERFGVPNKDLEEAKKKARADRFCADFNEGGKRKLPESGTGYELASKKRAREERFGTDGSADKTEAVKKKIRMERFGNVDEELKKKQREIRFQK